MQDLERAQIHWLYMTVKALKYQPPFFGDKL